MQNYLFLSYFHDPPSPHFCAEFCEKKKGLREYISSIYRKIR